MSNKTSFKRVALAVVAALGFGVLSTAPAAQAAIVGQALSLSSSSASITAGDTATTAVTLSFTPTSTNDSVTVSVSCVGPSGNSGCATGAGTQDGVFYWTPTVDSAAIVTQLQTASKGATTSGYITSFMMSGTTAGAAVSATVNFKNVTTTARTVGVYTYTIYTSSSNGAAPAATTSDKTVTFQVTVAAENTTPASVRTYLAPTADQAAYWATLPTVVTAKDSAVAVDRGSGTSTSVNAAAYVNFWVLNSAGETRTALKNTNICASGCSITATLTGPGMLSTGSASTLTRTSGTKSVTLTNRNQGSGWGAATDTLTIYADGTAGTATVTFYNGAVSMGSVSVLFTGDPASAAISLSDSTVAVGQSSVTVIGYVNDSAGNPYTNTTKSVYVYASDTKVVTGALSTDSAQFTQRAAGLVGAATACSYSSTLGYFSCGLTIADTGTASITLRDSWTVAASTWTSNAVTLTSLGVVAKAYTVTFDKATYNVGERAVITITGTDAAGRAVSNGATGAGLTVGGVVTTPSLGTAVKGTQGGIASDSGTFKGYVTDGGTETGIETRVVTMPSYSGDVSFAWSYTPVLSTAPVTVTATAKVVDPLEAVVKTTVANAQAAADAATDAALQAIDAANAATDAANLAAEAADAATVAAQESKDAADAATAAVESLATQVATLMAALQAQITSLANVVAKIAKKVKA